MAPGSQKGSPRGSARVIYITCTMGFGYGAEVMALYGYELKVGAAAGRPAGSTSSWTRTLEELSRSTLQQNQVPSLFELAAAAIPEEPPEKRRRVLLADCGASASASSASAAEEVAEEDLSMIDTLPPDVASRVRFLHDEHFDSAEYDYDDYELFYDSGKLERVFAECIQDILHIDVGPEPVMAPPPSEGAEALSHLEMRKRQFERDHKRWRNEGTAKTPIGLKAMQGDCHVSYAPTLHQRWSYFHSALTNLELVTPSGRAFKHEWRGADRVLQGLHLPQTRLRHRWQEEPRQAVRQ